MDKIPFKRIAIIGLGLIGGSIALAVKAKNKKIKIWGTAKSQQTLMAAKRLGIVDGTSLSAKDIVSDCDLVIIATPILEMEKILKRIAPRLKKETVITDVGSTKRQVEKWAGESLPKDVVFIGGHPMAGKEKNGIAWAEKDLFVGKTWVLTPNKTASIMSVKRMIRFVKSFGAKPLVLSGERHDKLVASISHLPLVLACLLVAMAGKSSWDQAQKLASSGFHDTTRLASGEPRMQGDLIATNKDNILRQLELFEKELGKLKLILKEGDYQNIARFLKKNQKTREDWLVNQT